MLFEDDGRLGVVPRADGAQPVASGIDLDVTQRELAQTKEYLRQVIEQHDAVTEQLRAANEEARSGNEELQSTNEELRTAKEQLQSTNEELTTVNDELQHRNRELSAASNDLGNILSATLIPIVMVGMDLRIRRFTPSAERMLGLLQIDIGRPVADLHLTIHLPGIESWIRETIDTLSVREQRVQDREGRWFNLCIRPYPFAMCCHLAISFPRLQAVPAKRFQIWNAVTRTAALATLTSVVQKHRCR